MSGNQPTRVDPVAALSAATKLIEFYRNQVLLLEQQVLTLVRAATPSAEESK